MYLLTLAISYLADSTSRASPTTSLCVLHNPLISPTCFSASNVNARGRLQAFIHHLLYNKRVNATRMSQGAWTYEWQGLPVTVFFGSDSLPGGQACCARQRLTPENLCPQWVGSQDGSTASILNFRPWGTKCCHWLRMLAHSQFHSLLLARVIVRRQRLIGSISSTGTPGDLTHSQLS